MRSSSNAQCLNAHDELPPLKPVSLGRISRACFPAAPPPMITGTMPTAHFHRLTLKPSFPDDIIEKAEAELGAITAILQAEGICVHRRPSSIDWLAEDGYTRACCETGLVSVCNTLVKACFAWSCRLRGIKKAYRGIFEELALEHPKACIVRRPQDIFANTMLNKNSSTENSP